MEFEFTAPLFRWAVRTDSWFFVALPFDVSDAITALPLPSKGFGSVKVRATVGHVTWDTSVFPDTERGTYVLPIKKAVRDRNSLGPDAVIDVTLEIVQ